MPSSSAAADEVHDFHRVAVGHDNLRKPLAFQDGKIVLDGHPTGIDIQPSQQVGHADGTVELKLFAVQGNVQGDVPQAAKQTCVAAYQSETSQVKVSS